MENKGLFDGTCHSNFILVGLRLDLMANSLKNPPSLMICIYISKLVGNSVMVKSEQRGCRKTSHMTLKLMKAARS